MSSASDDLRRRVETYLRAHPQVEIDRKELDRLVERALRAAEPDARALRSSRRAANDGFALVLRELSSRSGRASVSAEPMAAAADGRGFSGTATIAGVVTDAATEVGLENVEVKVHHSSGGEMLSVFTGADGSYETAPGLPAGTYFVRTSATPGYLDELWNDVSCRHGCDVTAGTPIVLADGATVSGVDFALAEGGGIAGTVTDAATELPLENVLVVVRDALGREVAQASTGADGTWETAQDLLPGSYRAHTDSVEGYVDELYAGAVCQPGCNVLGGTPIAVAGGATTGGVDFALEAGGAVGGTITDATTKLPLPAIVVAIHDANGRFVTEAYSEGDGSYATTAGLPSGSYYARVVDYSGYLDALYGGVPCWLDCDVTAGAAIAVTAGETTGGIDFALATGGKIAGTVTDSSTATGLDDIYVVIHDANGTYITEVWTTAGGAYETVRGLPTGTYFVRTDGLTDYLDELYSGALCSPGCDPTTGTGVAVVAGATTSGIDFPLEKGGKIAGTVTDTGGPAPIEGVEVVILDADGDYFTSGYSSPDGSYESYGALPTGTYRVRTSNFLGYLDELHDDLPCPFDCDVSAGDAVAVTAGTTTGGIDFALAPGGWIEGHVTAADSKLSLANGEVEIHDATGERVSFGFTDNNGSYKTLRGLPTGTYYAVSSTRQGYLDELYDGSPCALGCDPTTGDGIPVTQGAGVGGVDFELEKGGAIAGALTDSPSGLPLDSDFEIEIFDAGGEPVDRVESFSNGTFRSRRGLPNGTYYVAAADNFSDSIHRGALYPGIDCPWARCSPLAGTPIPVTAPDETAGVDFEMRRRMLVGDGFESAGFGAWDGGSGNGLACAHPICETGVVLDPACDPCVALIVADDGFCGEEQWDDLCVEETYSICGVSTCEWLPGPGGL